MNDCEVILDAIREWWIWYKAKHDWSGWVNTHATIETLLGEDTVLTWEHVTNSEDEEPVERILRFQSSTSKMEVEG